MPHDKMIQMIQMNDRCLHLSDEVRTAFFDDFMVLPATQQLRNVYEGMPDAVQRHDDMFRFTH